MGSSPVTIENQSLKHYINIDNYSVLTVSAPKNYGAVDTLKRLDRLGLLDPRIVLECLASISIDPYSFIATIYEHKARLLLPEDGICVNGDLVFRCSENVSDGSVMFSVNLFTNNIEVNFEDGNGLTPHFAATGADYYRSLRLINNPGTRLDVFINGINSHIKAARVRASERTKRVSS